MGFRTGMKVLVKKLGEAIIVKLTGDGALVSLVSAGGLTVKQSLADLEPLDDDIDLVPPSPPAQTAIDWDDFQQLRALEALRFGLVPESHLKLLTVGYDDLLQWIESCMPHHSRSSRIHEVCGPFGTGKSHTMALIRQIALEQGYLVAKIEIDGKSNNFSAPQRLLYNIWLSLQGKDLSAETPLLDLYIKAIQNGFDSIPKPLRDFAPFPQNFQYIKKLKNSQLLDSCASLIEEALAGSENVTATQVKADLAVETRTRSAQIYFKPMTVKGRHDKTVMFVLSLAGHAWLAKAAGYKGLVVTVDEFEAHRMLTAADRTKVVELLGTMGQYVSKNTVIPQAPLAIFIGAVSQDGHSGDVWVDQLVEQSNGKQYFLTAWSERQKQQLAKSIYELYRTTYQLAAAYDEELMEKTEALLNSRDQTDLVRAFIKYYMAVLDNEYGPGRTRTSGN
jgi:hypothetical protein